jgi:hypothetical protein
MDKIYTLRGCPGGPPAVPKEFMLKEQYESADKMKGR